MRRLVLVVLMLLLPLQSVWSAAATLCRHEAGPAAQHFGHHGAHHADASHVDADAADDTASDGTPGDGRALPGEVDHHHLSFVHPVPSMPAMPPPGPATGAAPAHPAERYASRWITGPDKPPRRLAPAVPARPAFPGIAQRFL